MRYDGEARVDGGAAIARCPGCAKCCAFAAAPPPGSRTPKRLEGRAAVEEILRTRHERMIRHMNSAETPAPRGYTGSAKVRAAFADACRCGPYEIGREAALTATAPRSMHLGASPEQHSMAQRAAGVTPRGPTSVEEKRPHATMSADRQVSSRLNLCSWLTCRTSVSNLRGGQLHVLLRQPPLQVQAASRARSSGCGNSLGKALPSVDSKERELCHAARPTRTGTLAPLHAPCRCGGHSIKLGVCPQAAGMSCDATLCCLQWLDDLLS